MTTGGTKAGTTATLLADTALGIVLAVVSIVTTAVLGWTPQPEPTMDGLGIGLLATAGMVLAVRRRWPLLTLAGTTLLIASYLLLGYPFGLIFLCFAVGVYTLARYRPLVIALPASLAALGLLLTHLLAGADNGFVGVLYGSGWAAVPFAIGVTVRARQEVAARERAELIRTHVDEERLRVAQEVHDIVGHGLAAIKMQADIALHVQSKQPGQARTALEAISRTSGDALAELRATLAAVRDSDGSARRSPAPGLARLDDLRRRMGEAGLAVGIESTGAARSLPPAVDLAGYRIVQESLTNVLRHSTAHQATVSIRYGEAAVDIVVTNPVDGTPGAETGSGIAGMRHRAQAVGGYFTAGPTADGRFEVHASLPTEGGA